MKKLTYLFACIGILISCDETGHEKNFQSICDVKYEKFTYRSSTPDNKLSSVTIKKNELIINAPSVDKLVDKPGTSHTFSYTGTQYIGEFSYSHSSTSESIKLGSIGYLCWKGFKTNFKNKVSFNETIIARKNK